jgi:PPOX class probable F420-dependent enzyme
MPSSTAPDSGSPAIATEKFVSLTTFTKDGTPKPTPVWIVGLADGRVGFTTSTDSWKAKRTRNTPKVTLRPCDQRGRVADDAIEVTGTAEVVDGAAFTQVKRLVGEKYGFMVTVVKVMNSVRGLFKKEETQSDGAIVITLD